MARRGKTLLVMPNTHRIQCATQHGNDMTHSGSNMTNMAMTWVPPSPPLLKTEHPSVPMQPNAATTWPTVAAIWLMWQWHEFPHPLSCSNTTPIVSNAATQRGNECQWHEFSHDPSPPLSLAWNTRWRGFNFLPTRLTHIPSLAWNARWRGYILFYFPQPVPSLARNVRQGGVSIFYIIFIVVSIFYILYYFIVVSIINLII